MQYTINKSNYRTFGKFAENRLEHRSYFIPFHAEQSMQKTDWFSERFESDAVTMLSGEWDFIYYRHASQLPKNFDTDKAEFQRIHVPSTWQKTGYDTVNYLNSRYPFACRPPKTPKNCPVGVYRKQFSLCPSEDGHYILTFLGVCASLDLYLNGVYIGYSEGSHNSAEFDVTKFLRSGENEIVAVVYKWSTGTYLECQDMFRENGIFRDVYITAQKKTYLFDFSFQTEKAGRGYNARVTADIRGAKGARWKAELFSPNGRIASETADAGEDIRFENLQVVEWNAEIPTCYDLVLTLLSGEHVLECTRQKVGFRTIQIDGCRFFFNNKLIKLKGVNHHDTHPVRGYAMTAADLKKDVELMKAYNVNCVRTSHYPPDPLFVTMCDVYGIYLVDEADMESHGCYKPKWIGDNPKWEPRFLDRMSALYERDKNHTCIIMWSMGNECTGIRNFDVSYAYLKSKTAIPVHYEPACRTERVRYDILAHFYTSPDDMRALARGEWKGNKNYDAPFFLCEYAHSMGVGPGGLDEYWNVIYSDDRFLGGCIWEWADHAHYSAAAKYKYTYGGDNGDRKNDGNFCCDGLFFPDRTPSPSAFCMKNVYSPLRAAYQNGKLLVTNTNRFASSEGIQIAYYLLKNGQKSEISYCDAVLQPEQTAELRADFQYGDTDDVFLILTYTQKKTGNVVGREQIMLQEALPQAAVRRQAVNWKQIGSCLCLEDAKRKIAWDRDGNLCCLTDRNGRDMLQNGSRGFVVQLAQALIDNHAYMKWPLKKAGVFHLRSGSGKRRYDDYLNTVSTTFPLFAGVKKRFSVVIESKAVMANKVRVTFTLTSLYKKPLDLPQIGLTLQLAGAYRNVRYYGMGDVECYSDFSKQSVMGVYTTRAEDMYVEYIKPQESGNRCGVRWAEVTDDTGAGVRITAIGQPLHFKAVDVEEKNLQVAKHREDVRRVDAAILHINGFMRGIGSASCGPDTASQYKKVLHYKESYTYAFDIEII